VQPGKTRHLPADSEQTLFQFLVCHVSGVVKSIPRLRHGSLLRHHPSVQRPPDVAQAVHGVEGAHLAARDAHQPHHLAFELAEAHQVERVLQDAAEAAVVFGSAQDDAIRLFHVAAQRKDALRLGFALAAGESEAVFDQVHQ